jgi:hypothetical protein
MLEELNLENIQDENARKCIKMLLNIIENLQAENRELKMENQRLRDEINRLKGEQGKPEIKANITSKGNKDISSEKERGKKKEWHKCSKKEKINIDREEIVQIEKTVLPVDAEFKGYEKVIVQDIVIKPDNILYYKEKYYSASEKKTYIAELPKGYEGEFGPGIKSLVIVLYYGNNITEPKLIEFFENFGIYISSGQISNLLIKKKNIFHEEKVDLYRAGLKSSLWQNTDGTGARVNGENQNCQIMSNPLYTAYFTTKKKDRLSMLDVLQNFRERRYLINEETIEYVITFSLPNYVIIKLKGLVGNKELNEEEFINLVDKEFPTLGKNHRQRLFESAGIASYHKQMEYPVVELLICDDAPQFKLLTEKLALCWIHEGRHYKKLEPEIHYHRQLLEAFLDKYWSFYEKLLDYKIEPKEEECIKLSTEFDELFSTKTGYKMLDDRIEKTREKKVSLLMVLEYPEIPLHNNSSEIEARRLVRKRDISFGTKTVEGTQASDTFLSLYATTRKLGISFYKYIYDRVSKTFEIPNLGEIINQKAKILQLVTFSGDG